MSEFTDDESPCDSCERDYCDSWEAMYCCDLCRHTYGDDEPPCDMCDPWDI